MAKTELQTITDTATHVAQELTHEIVSVAFRLRVYHVIRKILLGFIFVSIANVVFSYFFYTPKIYRITRDNYELLLRYRILQSRIQTAERHVGEIRHRDNSVYRQLFATDSLSIPGVWQAYPASKYAAWDDDMYASEITGTWQSLDALARTLYAESVSFDELQNLTRNKEKMGTSVPAIWPIDRGAMHGDHIGAFLPNGRLHPVLGYVRPHEGVDLGCNIGTSVYATGDATVEKASMGYDGGYGNMVLLNHGYGYETRYAHLSKILVQPGEHVVRGQIIAQSGNTGVTSGPHLHYEVIYRGVPVNPLNYFNSKQTPQEYEDLMSKTRETTYE